MQTGVNAAIYDYYASFYDATFGRVLGPGLQRAVERMSVRPGDRVLDLGTGTGMSLRHFPRACPVVGLDLSRGMLRVARRRIAGHPHQRLVRGDALRLPFADAVFDAVLVGHIVAVVPDSAQLLREVRRVARPGARIVLVNHFVSDKPAVGVVQRALSPVFSRMGWRTDLALQDILRAGGFVLESVEPHGPLGLWQVALMHTPPAAREAVEGARRHGGRKAEAASGSPEAVV